MALGSQDARLAGDPGVQDNKLSLNQVLSVKPPTCPPTPKRMVLGVVSKCQNLSCLKVFRIIVKSKKCFTDTKLFRRSEGMQVKVVGNPYTSCKCKLLLFNAFIVTLPAPTPPPPPLVVVRPLLGPRTSTQPAAPGTQPPPCSRLFLVRPLLPLKSPGPEEPSGRTRTKGGRRSLEEEGGGAGEPREGRRGAEAARGGARRVRARCVDVLTP